MPRTSSKESKFKIVKTIPSSEIEKVECLNSEYLITQNSLKEQFTLWKCSENGFEKISTSNNPLNFDKMIPYET